MKRIGVFLDYMRIPKILPNGIDSWQICRTDKEFVEFTTSYYREQRKMPELVSLAHDLAAQQIEYTLINPSGTPIPYEQFSEKTGLASAKWLCETCQKNSITIDFKICVHEQDNKMGARYIQELVNQYKEEKDCFMMDWKEYDYEQDKKEIYDSIKTREYNEFEEQMRLENIAKRLEKEIYNK